MAGALSNKYSSLFTSGRKSLIVMEMSCKSLIDKGRRSPKCRRSGGGDRCARGVSGEDSWGSEASLEGGGCTWGRYQGVQRRYEGGRQTGHG